MGLSLPEKISTSKDFDLTKYIRAFMHLVGADLAVIICILEHRNLEQFGYNPLIIL